MNHSLVRPVIFGEVLWDHFPDGTSVLGGAPLNVAWNLHAFGFNPLLITRIGRDAEGERVLRIMRERGMDCSGVQIDDKHPTGRVEVSLHGDGHPHYHIINHCAYDFIDRAQLPALDDRLHLLYHGSLALRHAPSRNALMTMGERCGAGRFVDVNLREPWWSLASLQPLLAEARWIKINDEELPQLCPYAYGEAAAIADIRGHHVDYVLLTRGAAGAEVFAAENQHHAIRPANTVKVVDTVGAGDAFSSVMIAGLIAGWPLAETMQRAQAFASRVVGLRGATSNDPAFYRQTLASWPSAAKEV